MVSLCNSLVYLKKIRWFTTCFVDIDFLSSFLNGIWAFCWYTKPNKSVGVGNYYTEHCFM